jgi:hypothetical protein
MLLSGAVWSTRTELAATHPSDYLDIISDLTVNSILMHSGTAIDEQITIDFLTLDDAPPAGDGNIYNGTPHAVEICAGFGAHGLGGVCDSIACGALAVHSCRDHGAAGTLCLDLGVSNGIEPRSGGITELEIDLDEAATFTGPVTVTCVNAGDQSARVFGTSVDGDTVTVSFSPALPDRDACTVELDCGAAICVRGLEGDANLSGQTNTTDTSQVKLRFDQDAATAGPEWDFNTDGQVNTTDYAQIKLRFGNSAPICP